MSRSTARRRVECGAYEAGPERGGCAGFAIKMKTEEGNLDWVFNNTPVFFIRDPAKFPHFIHTQKRDPQTHLKDPEYVRLAHFPITIAYNFLTFLSS